MSALTDQDATTTTGLDDVREATHDTTPTTATSTTTSTGPAAPEVRLTSGGPASAADLVSGPWLEDLLEKVTDSGVRLTGEGGFLPELVKTVLERGLAIELSDHLGYEWGDPAGRGSPNSRNGSTPKTVLTEVGPVGLAVPRDRVSTFEPRLVPKGARRVGGGLDEMIISLYAGGMTVRDIGHHLHRTLRTPDMGGGRTVRVGG